jgi:hypothetical protein
MRPLVGDGENEPVTRLACLTYGLYVTRNTVLGRGVVKFSIVATCCRILVLAFAAAPPAWADCPYKPDGGPFISGRAASFTPVLRSSSVVGSYAILQTPGKIIVAKAGEEVAVIDLPQGMQASYLFFPATGSAQNRFLIIERHTSSFLPIAITFAPVVLDLWKWSTGGPALAGHELFTQTYPAFTAPTVHVSPSAGNGLAMLVWIETNEPLFRSKAATLYRSDTGEPFGSILPFDPKFAIAAEITGALARIKDGNQVLGEFSLPPCSPAHVRGN